MKSLILFISLFCCQSLFSQEEKPNLEVRDIVIVFKTHFDNGYTDYSEAVQQKYSSSLMEASLKALDSSRMLPVWTGLLFMTDLH